MAGGISIAVTEVAVKKLFDPNISHELLAEFDNEVQKLEMLRRSRRLQVFHGGPIRDELSGGYSTKG